MGMYYDTPEERKKFDQNEWWRRNGKRVRAEDAAWQKKLDAERPTKEQIEQWARENKIKNEQIARRDCLDRRESLLHTIMTNKMNDLGTISCPHCFSTINVRSREFMRPIRVRIIIPEKFPVVCEHCKNQVSGDFEITLLEPDYNRIKKIIEDQNPYP